MIVTLQNDTKFTEIELPKEMFLALKFLSQDPDLIFCLVGVGV